jgi:hypothetical protein
MPDMHPTCPRCGNVMAGTGYGENGQPLPPGKTGHYCPTCEQVTYTNAWPSQPTPIMRNSGSIIPDTYTSGRHVHA